MDGKRRESISRGTCVYYIYNDCSVSLLWFVLCHIYIYIEGLEMCHVNLRHAFFLGTVT